MRTISIEEMPIEFQMEMRAKLLELHPVTEVNPMLSKQQVKTIRAAVRRLVDAEVDDAFKGGGDPNDYSAIEQELRAAKRNLSNVLRKLQTTI